MCSQRLAPSQPISLKHQLSHSIAGWTRHVHPDSGQYFSKRLDGRLYITNKRLPLLLEELESCIHHVEQRILNYKGQLLPQNIQVLLSPSANNVCSYYMVDVSPDCRRIFWLDEFETDYKYWSATHLSKSRLILWL